jgi:hypothetical protein
LVPSNKTLQNTLRWSRPLVWLLVLAGSLIPAALVVQAWDGGKPLAYTLGGLFPLTDGVVWWACSLQLAGLGNMPGPYGWAAFDSSGYCTNRPSHAGLLAALQLLAGFDPHALLLLIALLIGFGIVYLSLEAGRTFGWAAAVVVYLLVLAYASTHALSTFTSETSGLFLGAIGLAFLVRFMRTEAWPHAWSGIAILSIGLFTRAGAMLALPLLLAWIAWHARPLRGRERYAFLFAGTCSVAAGYILQKVLIALVGDAPSGHFSNFSVVLYGLATGSRDWREALVFYGVETPSPIETMNMIMPLALAKIWEQPGTFLLSLASAERDYLASLFNVPWLADLRPLLFVLLAIGLLVVATRIRRLGYQALALAALGEVLSAPLVFDADGLRVFAASFPIRGLLVAIAISALLQLVRRKSLYEPLAVDVGRRRGRGPALALALIVFAALFSATPLARPFRLAPVPAGDVACPDGVRPVVLVVNRASVSFLIDGESAAPAWSGVISPSLLERELRDAWFRDDFTQLPHNTLLLRAIDRHPENFGKEVSLIWMNADASVRDGDVLRLCLLPHLTRAPHRRHVRLSYHRFFFASPVYRTTLSDSGSRSR